MRFLLANILLLLLITQTVISRDNDAPVVRSLEMHSLSYHITNSSRQVDSIILGVGYSGGDIGVAEIAWSTFGGPFVRYTIKRRIGVVSPFIIIKNNVINPLFNDTIENGICGDSIFYQIVGINIINDSVYSNIAGNWFSETKYPLKPVFDSVSIADNGNVILGWTPSVSEDAMGTIIYLFNADNIPFEIDTVFDNQISYYEDLIRQPCIDKNIRYAIAAIDSCGNKSPGTFSKPLRPIFLYDISYDICSETNSLIWEPYINASPTLDKYQIWASINNGPISLIDEVAANVEYYNHTTVDNNTEYVYFVRAVFGNSTSSSCIKSIITSNFIKPKSVYLANANVLFDNNIELTIDVDLQPNSCSWEIFRSDAGGGSQTLLNTISRSEINTSPVIYLDEGADATTGYYTYTINVLDSCDALSLQSNTMKTIFLEGEQLSKNENRLSWNSFEGFAGEVDKYYIFRILGENIPTVPIDSTDAQTNEYTDDISLVEAGESKFSYWVQAKEGNLNSYGYQEKSNSNIISLFKETDLYFPNAFRPDGINNVFKPVATGFGGSNYLFQIFNRWGQLIFESTDPELGWDGKYKGSSSSQGTYIYRLVYQNVFNVTKQQQGTVTLID